MTAMPNLSNGSPALAIVAALKRAGIDLVTTLPDTWIGELIDALDADPDITLVRVSREDDGIGICAGAFLGGRRAALVAQNGGMLLSVNALAAFAFHHQIPILMILAQRGSHDDSQYYQVYKGRSTIPILQALNLPYHCVNSTEDLYLVEEAARQAFLSRVPIALLFSRRALIGNAPPKG